MATRTVIHSAGASRHQVTRTARRQRIRTVLRVAAALVLAGHGAIHLMGTLLLWRLSEPGTLRYADATPAAGSAGGLVVGSLWLVCALLFVAAAGACARGHRAALPLATVAAVLSAVLVSTMLSVTPVGLAVDVSIMGFAAAALQSRRAR